MKIQMENKKSIYLEIAEKIETFIKIGVYKDNEKLPSCRSLALELGVNPNTIERAYSTLEERGIIYTISKKGIFVSSKDNIKDDKETLEIIKHCKEKGIEKDELLKAIEVIYEGND